MSARAKRLRSQGYRFATAPRAAGRLVNSRSVAAAGPTHRRGPSCDWDHVLRDFTRQMMLGRDGARSREIGCKASGSKCQHLYPAAPASNHQRPRRS